MLGKRLPVLGVGQDRASDRPAEYLRGEGRQIEGRGAGERGRRALEAALLGEDDRRGVGEVVVRELAALELRALGLRVPRPRSVLGEHVANGQRGPAEQLSEGRVHGGELPDPARGEHA